MNTQHLTRQLSLIPTEVLDKRITIVGCGAIGSFLALSLAKMGATNLCLYDFDEVSIVNMSNQFFRFSDIGKNKALALRDLIKDFTGVEVDAVPEAFTSAQGMVGYIVSAVDSMIARKFIYDSVCSTPNGVSIIIDPRMAAEQYTQYTIKVQEQAERTRYNKVMFDDSQTVEAPCTAKSTVYTATLAAGCIVKTVKNLLLNEPYPKNIFWHIKHSQDPMAMSSGVL